MKKKMWGGGGIEPRILLDRHASADSAIGEADSGTVSWDFWSLTYR